MTRTVHDTTDTTDTTDTADGSGMTDASDAPDASRATPDLDLVDVAVDLEGRRVLEHVDLALAPGEVLGILGPSGGGKSTLLRAIAGLAPTASGSIRWRGDDIGRVPVHRRGFALVFQDGQLLPQRDVARNVGYALERRRMPRDEREARVAELLDLVGLAGFERRAVPELSGGEQQRVALARALAAEPRLLLLDEPLSALDRPLRSRLARDLRRILTATGMPGILVTHDARETAVVADRVAVLAAGRIVQIGSQQELTARPVDDLVASIVDVS